MLPLLYPTIIISPGMRLPCTLWISCGKSHCVWPWTWTTRKKGLLKTRWARLMITFRPLRFYSRGISLLVFHSSPGHTMQSEWHDIKVLPHQDWKVYIPFSFFFCLQAVNYLTSTHNEQCKTSQNLIKRQRQGPSADGKWLTQLIKHPSVRLNMASLSHHLKYGWDPLRISIFTFLFACGTFTAFIMLTPICSTSFIKVFMAVLTSLALVKPNADRVELALKELPDAV